MKNKLILSALILACVLASACTQPNAPKQVDGACTLTISCETILNNMDKLNQSKKDFVPENGLILDGAQVDFQKGESVFDILKRACMEAKIHLESSSTPGTNSKYIEGIAQLYEFDCGPGSGWEYKVNGEKMGVSCAQTQVNENDSISFEYTCDLGKDLE